MRTVVAQRIPGSGRSTSLCSVLRQCGVSAPRLIAPGAEYPVKLPDGAEASLAVSGMRSTNGYATPVEGYADPALRPEFDLLARADAIVFVVLSHSALLDVSAFHFEKLRQDLEFVGRPLDAVPIVFQANKQDWPAAPDLARIREQFAAPRCDYLPSVASQDLGTLGAVQAALQLRRARG